MTDQRTIERQTTALLSEVAPTHAPDRLYADVLTSIGRTRQRTRWLAYFKESPMRTPSGVAVGSPTFRLASILAIALGLILALGAAVAVGASLLPTPAIVVAQDGSGTVRTITEAVAMAADGDTILVKPGTYLGSIAITEDITLRGDGDRKAVVLEFAADGPRHGWDFAYGILLDGSSAHVENLTVHGPAKAVAIQIDGGAPVIDGVAIVLDGDPAGGDEGYRARSAFQIFGGSSAQIRDSTWDGYTAIQGSGANTPTFEGNLITTMDLRVTGGGNQPVIRGNTFLQGTVYWPDFGSGGIAEDNDIVGCIEVAAGNDPVIRGNRIRGGCTPDPSYDYRGAAIDIDGSSAVVVADNEITDSPYGIQVAGFGAKPMISGNTITGSISAAIILDSGAAPSIDGNTIEKNATGIEVVGTSTPAV